MSLNVEYLKTKAEEYKILYKLNKCTREEAKENILPYIEAINEKSKELAKKYNQKPRLITFSSYIR